MKLQELIQQVYYEPSLITPGAHAAIRRLLESRLGDALFEAREPGQGRCGEAIEVEQMVVDDQGIAHIPIGGAIGKNLSPIARGSGAVDVGDVTAELAQAEADDKVKGIILDIDSPGGMVLGTAELANRIAEAKKPVYAFSDGTIASAAYWLASAADGIFTTLTAGTGAIGVYVPWIDQSKAAEMEGFKVDVIKSGKFKGMGFPGTSLTAEQRDQIQSRVDELGTMFRAHVKAHRPRVAADDMEGQMFLGEQAQARGLIDAVVRNKAEMMAALFP